MSQSDKRILDLLMDKLTRMLGNKRLGIGYGVSAKNSLELCRVSDEGNVTSVATLAFGTKRQLINNIDFYMKFQSIVEKAKKGEDV